MDPYRPYRFDVASFKLSRRTMANSQDSVGWTRKINIEGICIAEVVEFLRSASMRRVINLILKSDKGDRYYLMSHSNNSQI
jgi:hypothetical protein